jgi:hypothetical protein
LIEWLLFMERRAIASRGSVPRELRPLVRPSTLGMETPLYIERIRDRQLKLTATLSGRPKLIDQFYPYY